MIHPHMVERTGIIRVLNNISLQGISGGYDFKYLQVASHELFLMRSWQ